MGKLFGFVGKFLKITGQPCKSEWWMKYAEIYLFFAISPMVGRGQ